MKLSYQGIGQWAATFACGKAAEGEMVKVTGGGTVGACGDGDAFCGQVVSVSRDGTACAVALGGMAVAAYSGDTAPALGWSGLSSDGNGGVKADAGGRNYLVADVDEAAKTVAFVL